MTSFLKLPTACHVLPVAGEAPAHLLVPAPDCSGLCHWSHHTISHFWGLVYGSFCLECPPFSLFHALLFAYFLLILY
jgi:hypothetical protein